MSTQSPKVVLVTGAGSGIGLASALAMSRAGHIVYASMRDVAGKNRDRSEFLNSIQEKEHIQLHPLELNVLSESSCRAAVDHILHEQQRLDVVLNNAGMLMSGITEGFTPEQVAEIFNTNALSWLRVNRAVLPVMRRQGNGLLIYTGSTTTRISEPFIGPYIASKAAGEMLAEAMAMENRPAGIESVMIVPGAFTEGTEHFSHSRGPEDIAVLNQYGPLITRMSRLGKSLESINRANGNESMTVDDVGKAIVRLLDIPHGSRPARIVVDPQNKETEELDELHAKKQSRFLNQMGLGDLLPE
ncbi:SDR family NAD(P)-dependent oxidoreductase [Pantoea stewartii]|uniref:SDR family NAD(P)-dependent oxidoreductase n=1 Tax=Pantoea stewartii TaxID=66269 RepID=UPI00162507ED|nr:SDR family NAD(P)-dependent oxidoreductase [Pantoea stewartii]MBC0856525.1 SDR family NAD(P)-dependent oxidoreductase [Pantoea stewartii]